MRRAIVLGLVAAAVVLTASGAGARSARAGVLTAIADGFNCSLLVPHINDTDLSLSSYNLGCDPITITTNGTGGNPTGSYGQLISYAPAGIEITGAVVVGAYGYSGSSTDPWWLGSAWGAGSDRWSDGAGQTVIDTTDLGAAYWDMQMICFSGFGCGAGQIAAQGVTLTGVELTGPNGLAAVGAGNIWYQTSHSIWNPPGDPWPMTTSATDPSGVCNFQAVVNGPRIFGPAWPQNQYAWQQCPSPNTWTPTQGAEIDTRTYVPNAGQLPLTVIATNAAGVTSSISRTLKVDNDPVRVALSTPNDANPSVWVNHAVSVTLAASAGPSGVGAESCAVDGAAAHPYPAGGVTINGDGIHHITCAAANKAVDPQGNPETGSASMSIAIDEAPPTVAFEPQNPTDPLQLVADTSDSESGVEGGSIQIAPAGTQTWTTLATSLAGSHLLARVDDTTLRGPYVIRATSCDAVGNCAATDETLTMPLRLPAQAAESFETIESPATVVRERVLVDWHYKLVQRHGEPQRVRVGGHRRTIRLVIPRNTACATKRVKTGRDRWQELRVCRPLKIATVSTKRVRFGQPVTLHGLLITAQGAPLADASVRIIAAPNNGLGQYAPLTTLTTSSDGTWSVQLPPGPSQSVRAIYAGTANVLPATSLPVTTTVPAKIGLSITPHLVPWANFIEVRGHLAGGQVPPDGVALRFLVRYPHTKRPNSLVSLRTNPRGQFSFTWSYNGGYGVATYPMSIALISNESDYPYAAAASHAIDVTFGVPTPARPIAHKRHTQPATTQRTTR